MTPHSWLFTPGADREAQEAALGSEAHVLILELEDFTPPQDRPKARALAPEFFAKAREAGKIAAVRVNPLGEDGMEDLRSVMIGAPDIVALPKVDTAEKVKALDLAVTQLENQFALPGTCRLLPNLESARAVARTAQIAAASPRVMGLLIASEDLSADMGLPRHPDMAALSYARQRFFFECCAAGVLAVDCPFTFEDVDAARADATWAARMGFTAKSCVAPAHAALINDALGASEEALREAARIVAAYEAAMAEGQSNISLDGSLVEKPTYLNAKALISRSADL